MKMPNLTFIPTDDVTLKTSLLNLDLSSWEWINKWINKNCWILWLSFSTDRRKLLHTEGNRAYPDWKVLWKVQVSDTTGVLIWKKASSCRSKLVYPWMRSMLASPRRRHSRDRNTANGGPGDMHSCSNPTRSYATWFPQGQDVSLLG